MKMRRLPRLLDYLPPVIAFVAAVGAVVGVPKWDAEVVGVVKLTGFGWGVFAVGLAALISSILVIRRNHGDAASQKLVKAEIARIGERQLMRGLDRVVCVFRHSSHWDSKATEPASPMDLLASERRSALSKLDLNSESPYADGTGHVKWWEMFENTAKQGADQITSALQIYVTFLEPEIIEAATKLIACEFHFRLAHTHDIVAANTRDDARRPVRFFWVDPEERMDSGYDEYWKLVARLTQLCTRSSEGGNIPWADVRERVS